MLFFFFSFSEVFSVPLLSERTPRRNTPLIFPPVPPPSSPVLLSATGRAHQADISQMHTGSSAGKARKKFFESTLHLSNTTRIMKFYPANLIRGFPHPSASCKPVGPINASGAHPFPSGIAERRGAAALTQKEKEQSRDEAGFSWRSIARLPPHARLPSCLLTPPREQRRQESPGTLLLPRKTASLVAGPSASFLPNTISKICIF